MRKHRLVLELNEAEIPRSYKATRAFLAASKYSNLCGLLDNIKSAEGIAHGWMICDFMSFSTVFQSYQDDGRMIMKGCVQWDPVYG